VYAEQGTKISVTGVNEAGSISGALKVSVVGADGTVVLDKSMKTKLDSRIGRLRCGGPRSRC
jgi:hypothetical protein